MNNALETLAQLSGQITEAGAALSWSFAAIAEFHQFNDPDRAGLVIKNLAAPLLAQQSELIRERNALFLKLLRKWEGNA